jgi:pseudouridine synthase, rluA family
MMKSRQNNERTDPKKGRTSAKSRTRSGKDLLADLNISASTGKVTQRPKPKTALPRVKTSAQEPKERKAAEPKVIFKKVDESNDGQRLDNFLLSQLKGVPKSLIYRVVRSGEVRVNKGRAHVDTRLQSGDEVRIPPIRYTEKESEHSAPPLKLSEMPPILFEDQNIMVVDKPAGMASHGGSGISYGLIERMRASRSELPFLELVHRLDRGTSGVLVLAKTRKALVRLHEMIREGEMHKTYQALVKGDWQNDRQHAKFPLFKYVTPSGERRVRVDPENGLPSHSIFRLKERFGPVSLVEVDLLTGRTHQIRVHAAELGFPLVGDEKYGDFAFNDEVAHGSLGVPFKRMFLHSGKICFHHPITGEELEIEAPLPKDCVELIEVLEQRKAQNK